MGPAGRILHNRSADRGAEPGDGIEGPSHTALARRAGRIPAVEVYTQAGAFLLYFSIVLGYQWLSQAYTAAFTGYADEPGHYVTGLMVRDYILGGFSGNPLAFAERFYVHYPAVGFGMWGPVFHFLEAFWMLAFSESRASIMLLAAVIAAGFAWSTQWIVARASGRITGVLAGFAVCLIPAFRTYSATVMADLLTGVLILWAAHWWSRYLETGRPSMPLGFAVFAALALLTKANAGALVLFAVPAVLLAGRADLLRRRSFWIPVPLVALLAGPWYVFYAWLQANITRVPLTPTIGFSYVVSCLGMFGTATIPFVLTGIGSGFFKETPPPDGSRTSWAVAVSMTLAFLAYYCLTPAGYEPRYILMAAPWVAVLLIAGTEWIFSAFSFFRRGVASTAMLAAIIIYGAATFHVHPKAGRYYADAAYDLVCRSNLPQSVFLISSESTVETVFVAEVAMRDRRPNHFVLRASKMLARMSWNGDRYENKVADRAQLRDQLNAWGVSRVIIDTKAGPAPWPHHRLLRNFVSTDPEWRLARKYGPLEVYAFQGAVQIPERIEVEVPYTLRRTLSAPRTGK